MIRSARFELVSSARIVSWHGSYCNWLFWCNNALPTSDADVLGTALDFFFGIANKAFRRLFL
jgi:hypothetical protein